jgi:hypothetical protein
MGMRIRCYTLFDITKTNITGRNPPANLEGKINIWQEKRNSQINFDTIIQIISLRAQPENISDPTKTKINPKELFGFASEMFEEVDVWCFDFNIGYTGVFDDGSSQLGYLYEDCNNVPMMKNSQELPEFLDISPELKNIHFEIISHD